MWIVYAILAELHTRQLPPRLRPLLFHWPIEAAAPGVIGEHTNRCFLSGSEDAPIAMMVDGRVEVVGATVVRHEDSYLGSPPLCVELERPQ